MPDTASTPLPSRKQMCNALRALAMGAVQKANSGHPGMPMGMMEGISHEAASLALQAQGQIAQAGVPVRVVSIPSTSAPAADVYRHFGLTVENLVATVQAVLSRESKS